MSDSTMPAHILAGSTDLRSEMARIFAAPQFERAPVMRRLLSYLVAQTLAGNGERLKAYTIAVDALGRDADFDAKQDSYPRVQVGRLRKLLDDFYAAQDTRSAIRIHIPKGAYAVDFGAVEGDRNTPLRDWKLQEKAARLPLTEGVRLVIVAITAVVATLAFSQLINAL